MKSFLTTILLLTSALAYGAAATYPDKGGNVINVIDNGQFEQGKTGWTASVGGSYTLNTSTPLDGKASAVWLPSAGSQTFTSKLYAIPAGLQGRACQVKILYKTAESTNRYLLQAFDGSSVALSQPTELQPLTAAREEYAYFTCPTSGTMQFKVSAPASAPSAAITLDNMHLGSITNGNQINQSSLFGSLHYAVTSTCTWTVSSAASYTAFAAVAACPVPSGSDLLGNALAPSTKIPAVRFSTLPAGDYRIEAVGHMQVSGAGDIASYQFYDGTTAAKEENMVYGSTSGNHTISNIVGTFHYSSAQSNVTFELKAKAGSNAYIITDNEALTFNVYYYPSVASTGYRVDTAAASWSGYHDQCQFNYSSPTYADTSSDTSGTCFLTALPGRNVNFGTVATLTSGGNPMPGIVFSAPHLGAYKVCASFQITTGSSGRSGVQMVSGAGEEMNKTWEVGNPSIETSGNICGLTNVDSLAPWTVKLQAFNANSTTGYISAALTQNHVISWTIEALNAPAPIFPGNVTSGSVGSERVERATINGNILGTFCTIASQSGAWVSSVASAGTGRCTLTIQAGVFSAAPTCTVSPFGGAGNYTANIYNSPTSTSVQLYDLGNGTAEESASMAVICTGPH